MKNPRKIYVLLSTVFLSLFLSAAVPAATAATPSYGPELQGFAYPFKLQHFRFVSQRQKLQMGFMDVAPERQAERPNGGAVPR